MDNCKVTYGAFALDLGTLPDAINGVPAKSVLALMKSGLTHKLGSEVASATSGALVSRAYASWKSAQGEREVGKEEADAQRKALRAAIAPNSDAYKAERTAQQSAMWDAILDGSIADAAERGPRLDPFEAEMEKIVIREIRTWAAKNKAAALVAGKDGALKVAAANAKLTWDTKLNFTGHPTIGSFKDKFLAKYKAKYEKEARANVAALEVKGNADAEPVDASELAI